MILKDITFSIPQKNILYDDLLLRLAGSGSGGEVLRFWEAQDYFIVLGRISKEEDDINWEPVQMDSIPVVRRSSGGGTVVQGRGCLNYSLILSKERNVQLADLRKSYQFILGKVISALSQLGAEAEFYPVSDIALKSNKKKISGNAQRRSRKYILHHGTILYDFDLSKIERYLKVPKDQPAYRESRSHCDFVTNINLTANNIKRTLKNVFQCTREVDVLTETEKSMLDASLEERNIIINPAGVERDRSLYL